MQLVMHKLIKQRCWWVIYLFGGLHLSAGAVFTVTNVNDAGVGSLRQVLLDAAANPGPDTVNFQIAAGPFSIAPLSALPTLTELILDGTSQPGYATQPIIELNGSSAGAGTVGLVLNASNVVRGLAINRFAKDGIRCDGPGNVIKGCCIGTDPSGTIARGNGQYGIFIFGSAGNQIGGDDNLDRNIISGGNDTGIYLLNATATGNQILGNYIGIAANGLTDLGNHNNGVVMFNAPANVLGGTAGGTRNVIAGNDSGGIYVEGPTGFGNVIQGNYIGLAANGLLAVSNSGDGITLKDVGATRIGGTNSGNGNVISGNGHSGILIFGNTARTNRIEGNFIGTDANGAVAVGNMFAGITLFGTTSNLIGGEVVAARNVISGNRQDGLYLTNSAGNVIQGNFIGTAGNGTNRLGNTLAGVAMVNSVSNLIGGGVAGMRNVISANGGMGVWLRGSGANGNTVAGNLIGTTSTSTNALGNSDAGIGITDASYNQIGGNGPGELNVIAANGFPANNGGVFITGNAATGNQFLGNRIGTDLTGLNALANRYEGIYIVGARSNIIGNELVGGGNLISGNTTRGLRITNSLGNVVRGNIIGLKADGVTALGNPQFGVELEENSSGNQVGGLVAGAGNRIAYNGGNLFAGVRVRDLSTNNAILGNSIYASGPAGGTVLGIDLSAVGVTANDGCDGDTGGNMRQNFPVLTQAYTGPNTGVRGLLTSTANTTFRLQFFSNPSCNNSGNGEGQIYLGDKLVTTDGSCSNNFVVTLPAGVTPGHVITATATDPANNTSEFSACLVVAALPGLTIAPVGANFLSLAWTNTAPGFVLQRATNLIPPVVWSLVTNVPAVVNNQFVVTLAGPGANTFYRLSFE